MNIRGREGEVVRNQKITMQHTFFLVPPPEIKHYFCNRTNKQNCVKKLVTKCKIKILQNKEQPKFNINF